MVRVRATTAGSISPKAASIAFYGRVRVRIRVRVSLDLACSCIASLPG